MVRRALIAGLLVVAGAAGCAEDEAPSTSEQDSSPTGEASSDVTEKTSAAPDPSSAPTVDGAAPPRELVGVFRGARDAYFAFYRPGHEVCTESVGTDQGCYAVRDARPESTAPIEIGVAAVDGDVLRWVPTQDPNASCIGAENEARWEASAQGVTITPTTDCHGLEPIELTRVG